jgi:hypothetical protein
VVEGQGARALTSSKSRKKGRLTGSVMIPDEHPRAGLESVRELSQGDLTALTSDE